MVMVALGLGYDNLSHCNMLILRTHIALVMSHLVLNGVGVGAGNGGGLGSWVLDLGLGFHALGCYGWLLCRLWPWLLCVGVGLCCFALLLRFSLVIVLALLYPGLCP
jgi:hypothetical protein